MQNNHGNTPLHKIVRMSCNNSALDFLIRSGADPYIENNKGKSPFDVASDSVKRNIKRLVNKAKNNEQSNKAPQTDETQQNEVEPSNLEQLPEEQVPQVSITPEG